MIENVPLMNIVRKINQELAISGQISQYQLNQIVEEGYKSVLNLCFADEECWWEDEQENTELLGLSYVNVPIKLENLNHQAALQVFQTISECPKPMLIHCDISIRSAGIVLLYIATKQGIDFEQAWQQTSKLCLLKK